MICERFVLALRPCPFSLLIRLLGLEPLYILISALEGNNWNSLLSAGVQAVRASSYANKFGFVKILLGFAHRPGRMPHQSGGRWM